MRGTVIAIGMAALLATATLVSSAAESVVVSPVSPAYARDAGQTQAAIVPVRWYGYYPRYYTYRPYRAYRPYTTYRPYVYDYAPEYYYTPPIPYGYYYYPFRYQYRYRGPTVYAY